MSNRAESTAAGTPAVPPTFDWYDDGNYRATFLAQFPTEHREVLQKAGAIFGSQAISGDTVDDSVFDPLRAAVEDARMLARHLQAVAGVRRWSSGSDREHELCREAEAWSRAAEYLAYTIEGWLEAAPRATLRP